MKLQPALQYLQADNSIGSMPVHFRTLMQCDKHNSKAIGFKNGDGISIAFFPGRLLFDLFHK